MDHHTLRQSIQDSSDSVQAVYLCTYTDGNVYIADSGEYLLQKEEAEKIIIACKKYLSHINNNTIIDYNSFLFNTRKKEDEDRLKKLRRIKTDKQTFIYVILNKRNGYYKIGRSNEVRRRENTLQSQEPELELVFHFTGTIKTETFLHQTFASKRLRGEWFTLDNADLEFIKAYSLKK